MLYHVQFKVRALSPVSQQGMEQARVNVRSPTELEVGVTVSISDHNDVWKTDVVATVQSLLDALQPTLDKDLR